MTKMFAVSCKYLSVVLSQCHKHFTYLFMFSEKSRGTTDAPTDVFPQRMRAAGIPRDYTAKIHWPWELARTLGRSGGTFDTLKFK